MIQELRYVGWEHDRLDDEISELDLTEIVERALRGLEDLGGELASDMLGRSTVWRCVTSRQLTAPTVERLCTELGLDGDWLMLGTEPRVKRDRAERPGFSRLGALVRELGQRSEPAAPEIGEQQWTPALA